MANGAKIATLVILGTRPEAIKLAPVIKVLQASPERYVVRVCATAQHRQMLDQALAPFGIRPDIDLDIMTVGQTLSELTARAVTELDRVIASERPNVVLVQGDTTTAFCGALAAFYNHVPVAHVEAGLRTGNKYAPFPEEANRCFIGQVAEFHFAPTDRAASALLAAGVAARNIHVTGNTVVDALLWMREKVAAMPPSLPEGFEASVDGRDVVMVTGHRRESFGEGFENICLAIRDVADAFPNVAFVYPVHLNPNVREPVGRVLGNHPRIHLLEPLPYDAFVWLMNRSDLVLTDSGGVQEEAPVLGKPVLVMRVTTERGEGIEAGNARLVGVGRNDITTGLTDLLRSPETRKAMGSARSPYGDGRAAARIVSILAEAMGDPARHFHRN